MGTIVQLQNKVTGENQYPRTYTTAVIDENATPLSTLMEQQDDKITELASEIDDINIKNNILGNNTLQEGESIIQQKRYDNNYLLGSGYGLGVLSDFYVITYDVSSWVGRKIKAVYNTGGSGILFYAFYNSEIISENSFIKGSSVYEKGFIYIPEGAKMFAVTVYQKPNEAKVFIPSFKWEQFAKNADVGNIKNMVNEIYDSISPNANYKTIKNLDVLTTTNNSYLLGNGSGMGSADGFYVVTYDVSEVNSIHSEFVKSGSGILYMAFYSSNEISPSSYIYGVNKIDAIDNILSVPTDAKIVAITTTNKDSALVSSVALVKTKFIKDEDLGSYSTNFWDGKTIGLIGDSITEICNGDTLPTDSWGYYIAKKIKCNIVSRGIGGSLMSYHIGETLYFDENGKRVSEESHVVSTDCWGMCMLERIKAQFPNTIKNDIDAVILMGGTNDKLLNRSIGDLSFIEHDSTDKEWSNSDMYCGGDFNIKTFKGAVASALMKLQKWMPNAVIILATPLSGDGEEYNSNSTEQWKNSNGETMQDFANAAIEAAKYLSIPIIDINQKTGINPFNRSKYIYDNVHPYYEAGKKAMARVFIGGLASILPNI